jgi:hypothetical protein
LFEKSEILIVDEKKNIQKLEILIVDEKKNIQNIIELINFHTQTDHKIHQSFL